MTQKYLNLVLVPGIKTSFSFVLKDDTGLPLDLTGATYRLEFLDSMARLVVLKTTPLGASNGVVTFEVTAEDGVALREALYRYRLVMTSSGGVVNLVYSGFMKTDPIPFDSTGLPSSNQITFPDGTIYPLSSIILQPNTWYAIASFFRLIVTGASTIGMDARDVHGNITGNIDIFQTTLPDPVVWNPNLSGNTAFRINVVQGGATIQYLP